MSRKGQAAIGVAAVVFVVGAAYAVTQVLGTPGTPGGTSTPTSTAEDTSDPGSDPGGNATAAGTAFLEAWAGRNYARMQALVLDQADDMVRIYGGLARRLKLGKITVTPGRLDAERNVLPYTATLDVAGHPWAYTGAVPLTRTASGWRVAFTSQTVHPDLSNGQTLTLTSPSAAVKLLDRTGRDLATDDDLEVNLLGQQGVSGLRRVVARKAPGALQLVIQDAGSGETLSVLKRWGPSKPAAGVRTTISLPMQRAAESALRRIAGAAALVAIDVPTGELRALANQPTTGIPPALTPYPPGSTFKVITAAAALRQGVTPSSRIACPRSTVINGRTVHNHEKADLGTVTVRTAFAQSCNTAFALLGARLPPGALADAAAEFGFGVDDLLPISSPGGSLPPPANPAQIVEDSIGQGNVTASPLAMAAVAAAVGSGTWHQPHVLPCSSCAAHPVPHASALRALMRAVVTSGTGTALAGIGGGPVYGKTGTAEYGSGEELPTHAWFVGWQGRTAFAVFAENGSSGGAVAAPAAARFLRLLR
jgi:hypothetical protein